MNHDGWIDVTDPADLGKALGLDGSSLDRDVYSVITALAGSDSLTTLITSSVKVSQPLP